MSTDSPGPARPRPGYGTVFVMRLSAAEWTASWHDVGAAALVETWGAREDVLAWARGKDAAEKLVFDWSVQTYRPLAPSGPVECGLPGARSSPADGPSAA